MFDYGVVLLTESGLFKLISKSKLAITPIFKLWIIELLKDIHLNGPRGSIPESLLSDSDDTVIFIYLNSDDTSNIGMGFYKSIEFIKIDPLGKRVFKKRLLNLSCDEVEIVEGYLNLKLRRFYEKGRFTIGVEEAKMCICNLANDLKLFTIDNTETRTTALTNTYESTNNIMSKIVS